MFIVRLAAAAIFTTTAIAGASGTTTAVSPEVALSKLMDGNRHFIKGDLESIQKYSSPSIRKDLGLNGQHPYAVIIDCSDSRVPPEIVFDKGLGEVFVVRVAGNVVAPHELGSVEYALEHLGAKLVMVLGHSKCGAVTTTYNYVAGQEVPENIMSLAKSIMPAVEVAKSHGGDIEAAIDENVKLVAEELETKSKLIKEFVEAKGVKIVKAKYDVVTGAVTLQP
jgi:carbonic anhydrase